jgi:hypothetical protein
MRIMEIGLRAMARSLGIPDPTKGWERNWGSMLRAIKGAMDARIAANSVPWRPGDQEIFDEAYAQADSVRLAWRNPTMHVEKTYTDEKADDIYHLVRGYMRTLADRLDENGDPRA